MDYEVERSTRQCATTGRQFAPGEEYFSVLMAEGAEVRRYDYAAEAWQGPPPQALGWWRSRVPLPPSRSRWAPNDVLLGYFDELAEQPARADVRYVLALLLVRRRVFRVEEERTDTPGQEVLVLYCPRREATYEAPVVMPGQARVDEIQQELMQLLK
jgi:hypothetical protein